MYKLYIGNKNYSSWSMRPWVLMRQAGIPFEEIQVRFDSFSAGSRFKQTLAGVTPAGRVPVLVDGDFAVWDSLAIAEYLAERHSAKHLWPQDARVRARARSVCAEMHAGFGELRRLCPMNIEAYLPDVGERLWREHPALQHDVARITGMWTELLAQHPAREGLLFGPFSIADAFFVPVCMRLATYALPVPDPVAGYMARVQALPGVVAWVDEALAEKDFLDFEEPYRKQRG